MSGQLAIRGMCLDATLDCGRRSRNVLPSCAGRALSCPVDSCSEIEPRVRSQPMRHIALVVSLVCYPALAWSQNRPRLVSPDVQSDGRVVFRLWAPEANGVQLSGDWMGRQPPPPLAKGTDGVWTVTIEPM